MTTAAEAPVGSAAETAVGDETLRISITGHRPGDLGAYDLPVAISDFLQRAAQRAKSLGLSRVEVITGGALGVDQEVAAAVEATPLIDGIVFSNRIILPFPIEVMNKRWRSVDRQRLIDLVERAGGAQVIHDDFAYWAYHARNAAMVDAAVMVIAFWNGKLSGGTFACIKYALKVDKPIWNALDSFRRLRPVDLVAAA